MYPPQTTPLPKPLSLPHSLRPNALCLPLSLRPFWQVGSAQR